MAGSVRTPRRLLGLDRVVHARAQVFHQLRGHFTDVTAVHQVRAQLPNIAVRFALQGMVQLRHFQPLATCEAVWREVMVVLRKTEPAPMPKVELAQQLFGYQLRSTPRHDCLTEREHDRFLVAIRVVRPDRVHQR